HHQRSAAEGGFRVPRLSVVLAAIVLACVLPISESARGEEGFSLRRLFQFDEPAREEAVTLDRAEAKKALDYLHKLRADPVGMGRAIGLDLSGVMPRPPVKWHPTVAKVAEEKATDMAKRRYFAHSTPEGIGINQMLDDAGYKLADYMLRKKSNNFFES